MARKKRVTTVYLEPEQDELLKKLAELTGRPMATFVREGVEYILARHREVLADQQELPL